MGDHKYIFRGRMREEVTQKRDNSNIYRPFYSVLWFHHGRRCFLLLHTARFFNQDCHFCFPLLFKKEVKRLSGWQPWPGGFPGVYLPRPRASFILRFWRYRTWARRTRAICLRPSGLTAPWGKAKTMALHKIFRPSLGTRSCGNPGLSTFACWDRLGLMGLSNRRRGSSDCSSFSTAFRLFFLLFFSVSSIRSSSVKIRLVSQIITSRQISLSVDSTKQYSFRLRQELKKSCQASTVGGGRKVSDQILCMPNRIGKCSQSIEHTESEMERDGGEKRWKWQVVGRCQVCFVARWPW